jgi:hypothetical protein
LNIGVGSSDIEVVSDFYIISSNTLNTFSKKDAERYVSYGEHRIEDVKKIMLIPLNTIIKNYFKKTPNLISMDTEGMDLQILQSLDWNSYRPEVLCIETLTYTQNDTEEKIIEIINFIKSKEYMIYADTYINTIFVDQRLWNNRKRKM